MSDAIYKAPEFDLTDVELPEEGNLASRWMRLWGSMIDGTIMMVILLVIMYYTGFFDYITAGEEPPLLYGAILGLIGIGVFIGLHGITLLSDGQTLGKKIVGTKIVDPKGNVPTVGRYIVRYAVYFLPGQVPVIGQLISLINPLFIFGKEKRCLHDHIAKTKVVNV